MTLTSHCHRISDSTPTSALLKSKVEAFLHNRHSAEKMLRCWGPGAGVKHQETKEAIQNLLKEYLTSFDMDEASRWGLLRDRVHDKLPAVFIICLYLPLG